MGIPFGLHDTAISSMSVREMFKKRAEELEQGKGACPKATQDTDEGADGSDRGRPADFQNVPK